MSETKHTPGSWEHYGGTLHLSHPTHRIVAESRDDLGRLHTICIAEVHTTAGHEDEALPNAQLLKAAPGLQKALVTVADDIEDYLQGKWDGNNVGWKVLADFARDAIAKSVGDED